MNCVGKGLSEYMKRTGATKSEIAKRLRIKSRTTLYKKMSGESGLTFFEAGEVAEMMGVSMRDLLGMIEDEQPRVA
jgi:transcriptional regulator with XRE-family HTH domain